METIGLVALAGFVALGIIMNTRCGPHSEWGRQNRINKLVKDEGATRRWAACVVYTRDVTRGMKLRPTERAEFIEAAEAERESTRT